MGFPVSVIIIPASFRLYQKVYSPDVVNKIIKKLDKTVNDELEIMERMFRRTTKTWRHNVEFYRDVQMFSDNMEGAVWTDDEIYFYLDRGTSVRHAVMSRHFIAKTRPRIIGSRAGYDPDPVLVSKSTIRPGIEPRRFTDEIYNRRINPYLKKLRKIAYDVAWKYSGIGDIR